MMSKLMNRFESFTSEELLFLIESITAQKHYMLPLSRFDKTDWDLIIRLGEEAREAYYKKDNKKGREE